MSAGELGFSMMKAKAKGRGGKVKASAVAPGKQVDLEVLRHKIVNFVSGKALAMVRATTEEAVKVGDLSAMKYLFELIGLHPATASMTSQADSDDGNDIAAALLAELGISTDSEAEAAGGDEVEALVGSDSVE